MTRRVSAVERLVLPSATIALMSRRREAASTSTSAPVERPSAPTSPRARPADSRATSRRPRRRGPTSSRMRRDRRRCGRGRARRRAGRRSRLVRAAQRGAARRRDRRRRRARSGWPRRFFDGTYHPESGSPSEVVKETSRCGTANVPIGLRYLPVVHSASATGKTPKRATRKPTTTATMRLTQRRRRVAALRPRSRHGTRTPSATSTTPAGRAARRSRRCPTRRRPPRSLPRRVRAHRTRTRARSQAGTQPPVGGGRRGGHRQWDEAGGEVIAGRRPGLRLHELRVDDVQRDERNADVETQLPRDRASGGDAAAMPAGDALPRPANTSERAEDQQEQAPAEHAEADRQRMSDACRRP